MAGLDGRRRGRAHFGRRGLAPYHGAKDRRMITTRTEAGALPLIGAGKALSAVGNVLLIAYTASEIAEWQDEEEADGKDADFCAQPLIPSARTYWAAQIGNYAAQ